MLFTGPIVFDAWKDLEYCVRTGEPAFRKNSPDLDAFAAFARDPEAAARFDAAMAAMAPITAAAVAAAYDFSAFRSVVDVGGGNGAILIGILNANPQLRGIVFDQPPTAERAKKKSPPLESAPAARLSAETSSRKFRPAPMPTC